MQNLFLQLYDRFLNSETSFQFIENQLITNFWKTVKAVIKWTDLFSKTVREFVMWGDLVSILVQGQNWNPFKIAMAPESKRIYSFTVNNFFFQNENRERLTI